MSMVANSSADQSKGFLAVKLIAGTNIALTTVNPGGDEALRIEATGGSTDEKVKTDATDTTAEYLYDKILTSGITKGIVDIGGVKKVALSGSPVVKANDADPVPNVLVTGPGNDRGKLKAGANITITPVISGTPGVGVQAVFDALGAPVEDISNSCTSSGFTAPATIKMFKRALGDGKMIVLEFVVAGTADAGTVRTVTLPVALTANSIILGQYVGSVRINEASVYQPNPGMVVIDTGSNILQFGKTWVSADGMMPNVFMFLAGSIIYELN